MACALHFTPERHDQPSRLKRPRQPECRYWCVRTMSDQRDEAIVQFAGGYIAEIYSAAKPNASH
jgi:hypothetical protein